MSDCDICANTYTNFLRKPIYCIYCNKKCCLKCFKMYITNIETAFKCMFCNEIFEIDFLKQNLSKNYLNTIIKNLEENIIFENEKKYLIITQRELDLKKKQDEILNLINEHKLELESIPKFRNDGLDHAIQESIIFELEFQIKHLSFNYIKKCGNYKCKGMLNEDEIGSYYLCSLCNLKSCKKCEAFLSEENEANHICDDNILQNLQNLKEETKPCPSCFARIYKSEGCRQMYCIQCFTVFDWDTGAIETGKIHNPHFLQSFKYYNRDPLDILCGRELETRFWNDDDHKYNLLIKHDKFKLYFCAMFNSAAYIANEIKNYTNEASINKHLRIKYLKDYISEQLFKKLCLVNINHAKLQKKLLDIIITYMNCGNEIFYRLFDIFDNETKNLNNAIFDAFVKELENFTDICNIEYNLLSPIKKNFNTLSYGIDRF